MTPEILIPLLAATVQSGTPILFATLGAICCEKSGVLNLGVEGSMAMGALAGFYISFVTGNCWLGFLAGGLSGVLMGAIHGIVCLGFLGNQVVSGLALTILGVGLANYLGTPLIGQNAPGFTPMALPGLSSTPFMGPIFFKQDALVYISYLIPLILWLFFQNTRAGLRLRSVGENPDAASASGINPVNYRWLGVLGGGFFMGLGGAYLSLAYTHMWANHLSAGRGWIAVALVIFAFWNPLRAVAGAYLFGGIMAFQFRLQASGTHIPSSFLLMLPYGLTLIVLVFSSWKGSNVATPQALGVNIEPAD
ncbi:MAG: ABC transporter permease [Desulfobacterales bacterium]|nr:ABC transporter permease [Desulfobacterales bacterium]